MKKPGNVQLPDGTTYRAVVLQVVESDGRGPRLFKIVRDDETVAVADDMAFWIVYAQAAVLDQQKPN